ncbi:MAG: hypothetical protein ACRD0P_16795, partial [Stackebrandtia sp.]
RDRLLTVAMRRGAAERGLPTMDVDGSLGLEQSAERLASFFSPVFERGPRARDGAERARLRRAENTETFTAVSMYLDDLGAKAPVEPPPVTFACECENLGCGAEVELPPARFRDLESVFAH